MDRLSWSPNRLPGRADRGAEARDSYPGPGKSASRYARIHDLYGTLHGSCRPGGWPPISGIVGIRAMEDFKPLGYQPGLAGGGALLLPEHDFGMLGNCLALFGQRLFPERPDPRLVIWVADQQRCRVGPEAMRQRLEDRL